MSGRTCWHQHDPIIGYQPVATLAVLLALPDLLGVLIYPHLYTRPDLVIIMRYVEDDMLAMSEIQPV